MLSKIMESSLFIGEKSTPTTHSQPKNHLSVNFSEDDEENEDRPQTMDMAIIQALAYENANPKNVHDMNYVC